jgi:hypothetical protein
MLKIFLRGEHISKVHFFELDETNIKCLFLALKTSARTYDAKYKICLIYFLERTYKFLLLIAFIRLRFNLLNI